QRLLGGRPTRLGLEREGHAVDASFVPPPMVLEEDPGLDVEYDMLVASDGSRLRTILSRPAGVQGRLPVLFFTQWVSCGSLEGPAAAQVRALAAGAGMALMRVERAGTGDSLGPACHQLDFDTEVRHYREAPDRVRGALAWWRVARLGPGDSLARACHQLDFDTEVRHYREALDRLLRHPWIDP